MIEEVYDVEAAEAARADARLEADRAWTECATCGRGYDSRHPGLHLCPDIDECPCGATGDPQSIREHIESRVCPEGGYI